MSGGHFNYDQRRILYIIEDIEDALQYENNPEVLQRLKEAIEALKKAYVYAQRIDWYFSGDDGEESFLRRLNEELNEL